MKKVWLIVLLLLVNACVDATPPEEMAPVTPAILTIEPTTTLPVSTRTIATLTTTPTRTPTPWIGTATGSPLTQTPAATAVPTDTLGPTPTTTNILPTSITTPTATLGGILALYETPGVSVPICAQIDVQGNVYPLEPDSQSGFSWCNPYRSPDGQWLAYERHSEQEDELILHNALTHEKQTIKMPNGTSLLNPVFDAANRRIAYTLVADPVKQINGHHAWAIYVRDLATGTETLFGGPSISRPDDELQPSRPIAWIGDDLLLNAFTYLGEDVNQGILVLDISQTVPGEAVFLQMYDRQVLSIQAISPRAYRKPTVSPDGSVLAFLIHDYDYKITCLERMADDPGLTVALGIVPTTGGQPGILVDITGENSTMFRSLAWSPDGKQILFAQSKCQGETSLSEVALHTVDLQGNITGEWLLMPIDNMWSFSTLWCTPDDVFYVRDWDELRHLDLSTGQDEQVLSGEFVQLVGCLP